MQVIVLLIGIIVGCFSSLGKVHALTVSGVNFVNHFDYDGQRLYLNGTAKNNAKFSFIAALYLTHLKKSAIDIVEDEHIKVLEIKFLENVPAQPLIEKWLKAVQKHKRTEYLTRIRKVFEKSTSKFVAGDRLFIVFEGRDTRFFLNGISLMRTRWKPAGISVLWSYLDGVTFSDELSKGLLGSMQK